MANLSVIKKLAGDSLIYGVSGVVSRFIGIFLVPIYTRIFTPTDYGIISLVITLFTLLSILVVLGLDNSLARWFYDDEDESDRKISLNTFLWSCFAAACIFAVLVVALQDFIALKILQEPLTKPALLIAALNLPLTVFTTFSANVLRIQRRAAAASVFSLSIALLTIALNVLFVVIIRTGYIGVFYAQLLTSIIAAIWTLILFKDSINPRFFNWHRWKEMFRFSFPLIPGSIAFWVINLSGVYFIQTFQNAAEVGLYQIGISIASAMALLTGAFQMAWGPFAFSIHKQPEAKEIYAQTLNLYMGATCAVAVLITLFARETLLVLATEAYVSAFWVAGILAFNHLVIGLGYLASIGTSLAKNNKAYGIASVISAGLLVLLNLIFVPRFGKEGAAAATLASQIIIPAAVFWHAQILYPIPYNFTKAFLIFPGSLIAGFGTLFFINEIPLNIYSQIALKTAIAVIFLTILFFALNIKEHLFGHFAKSEIKS
ncbi:MAG TPA: oligosaccharide flippase family protein [Pyrinomonadaceae bacterium]|nr:oligosaccharide flippase family protein [Pyrinomonadaceae bacterium]